MSSVENDLIFAKTLRV